MAQREISVEPDTRGNFSQRTILDGREFLLTFRWNQREAKWYLSIADANEVPIIQGVKIVLNFPLLTKRIVDERRPPGDIMAVDSSGDERDPGFNDLGERVRLLYIEGADIP